MLHSIIGIVCACSPLAEFLKAYACVQGWDMHVQNVLHGGVHLIKFLSLKHLTFWIVSHALLGGIRQRAEVWALLRAVISLTTKVTSSDPYQLDVIKLLKSWKRGLTTDDMEMSGKTPLLCEQL